MNAPSVAGERLDRGKRGKLVEGRGEKKSKQSKRRRRRKRNAFTASRERLSMIVLFQTAAEHRTTTCTRRGGPLLALMWPYVAPTSLRLSDLTWSSLEAVFTEGPYPPFLSECARKWLRRPTWPFPFALPLSLSLRRKGVEPNRPFPCHYKNLAVSNRLPFSLFQTHPLWRLIARIKKYSSTAFLHGTDHDGCSRAWLGNLRFSCL